MEQQTTITCEELASCLDGEDAWVLLDVRNLDEYREAHIEGATWLPLPELEPHLPRLREEYQGKRIALICRSGQRAVTAQEMLSGAGVQCEAAVLEGGMIRWQEEKRPIARISRLSTEQKVRLLLGFVVLGASVTGALLSY